MAYGEAYGGQVEAYSEAYSDAVRQTSIEAWNWLSQTVLDHPHDPPPPPPWRTQSWDTTPCAESLQSSYMGFYPQSDFTHGVASPDPAACLRSYTVNGVRPSHQKSICLTQ